MEKGHCEGQNFKLKEVQHLEEEEEEGGLSGMNLNLHHPEGSSSDTYFILHSTNIQTQTAYE